MAVQWTSSSFLFFLITGSDAVCVFVLQVKHLEVSCSSMAEDICRKSAIIETYVMDSRIGEHTHTHSWRHHHQPTPNLHLHSSVLRYADMSQDQSLNTCLFQLSDLYFFIYFPSNLQMFEFRVYFFLFSKLLTQCLYIYIIYISQNACLPKVYADILVLWSTLE